MSTEFIDVNLPCIWKTCGWKKRDITSKSVLFVNEKILAKILPQVA